MYNYKKLIYMICVIITAISLFACASAPKPTPPPPNDDNAVLSRAAADRAFNDLRGGGSAPTSTSTPTPTRNSGVSSPQPTVSSSTTRPRWTENPSSVYSTARYVTGVGVGVNRDMATKNALADLSSFFGQSIQSDQRSSYQYNDAIRSGAFNDFMETSTIRSNVITEVALDELFGAEIKEVWQESATREYFALAVLDKTIAAQIYSDKIVANKSIIDNLLNIAPSDRNTLAEYSRYQLASVIADINVKYSNLLQTINYNSPIPVTSGDYYRIELQNLAKRISIGVRVRGDKANRISNALTKTITDLGFRSDGPSSRHLLDVNIIMEPVVYPNQRDNFKYVRYDFDLNLRDTVLNSVLTTWSFGDREGHTSVSEAENRVIRTIDDKINKEFKNYFLNFLSQMLPKK